ncbi:hypothetical protein HK102_000200 [Quaeritorhiza haematococci]|nr:hypothetical protein HK102_000200 [Quaeritorhiza haematococci]
MKSPDAIEELQERFGVLHDIFYGNQQFLICYAAAGSRLGFFVIDRNQNLEPMSAMFNLQSKHDRLEILCFVINILRLFKTIAPMIPQQPLLKLGKRFQHGDSVITIFPKKVLKEVKPITKLFGYSESHDQRLEYLEQIYKHARNAPGLVQEVMDCKGLKDAYSIEISTIGIPVKRVAPRDETELRQMVLAILLGLSHLHAGSFVHRDKCLDLPSTTVSSPSVCLDQF